MRGGGSQGRAGTGASLAKRTTASVQVMESSATSPRVRVGRASLGGLLAVALLCGAVGSSPAEALPNEHAGIELVFIPLAPVVRSGTWRSSPEAVRLGLSPMRSPLEDEAERAARVDAVFGAVRDDDPARREAALDAARLFESAGDVEAARFAYLRAIANGDDDPATFRALGRVALATGDGVLAEAAQLGALERLASVSDPILFVELRAKIHRDLVVVYRLDGRARDAALALDGAEGLAPMDRTTAHWLARQRFPLSLVPPPFPGAPTPDWPEPSRESWWAMTSRLAGGAWDAVPEPLRVRVAAATAWLVDDSHRRTVVTVAIGLMAFALLMRLIRQRGDLIVTVAYPDELRGVFRIRVSSVRARPRRPSESWQAEVRKGGVSTRYERHLVNRETQFNRLLTRRYAVTVEGVLLDPETEELLGDFSECKEVRLRHRRTVRLEFDAQPDACPVDVDVFWHDKPAEDVAVVAVDQPESLVRSPEHRVRLGLDLGRHRLVVGAGDRVVEREIDVRSYRPTRVKMDLAGAEVVFKGCPPAVNPYLRGEIEEVAHALERDGQAVLAYRMLARHHAECDDPSRAADFYESAGDTRQAAQIRAEIGEFVRSARLYGQAGRPREAAEMWRRAGSLVEAGQAYERAEDLEAAVECYREANAVDSWIAVLERRGRTFEAAKLALDADQRPRAIRLLQVIPPDDPDFTEASWLLVGVFERELHFDLAAQKLEQHIASHPARGAPADRYAKLAELHEGAGHIERALDVLDDLRRREPTYPNIASRIESLKKQRSADRFAQTTGLGAEATDAPTAFVADQRYEIQGELGRGGMGVVFEARDRRLDRTVALKRLPEDLRRHHPRAVQLFLRAAPAAARRHHPNIVPVHDTDQEDGHFFITMELLDGEPFNRILRQRGRLSVAQTITVGLQVASALEYAHGQGVVHRDVKTANLFLTTENVVKVMDFGLAKMFEEVRGGTTVISGTPYYMSPEQVLGASVDQRSDLYSLGVTLFELSTGRVPFAQGDIAYHHRHTPPPDPRAIRPDMPAAFARLLLQLLEKDVDARVGSASELTTRLRALQRDLRPPPSSPSATA